MMMDCYKGFAAVYDLFMAKDIPYAKWAAYIDKILKENDITQNSPVLDLACGTGNITLPLAERGYDLIGVDISEDMLAQAQNKAFDCGQRILWLAQDMRGLDLYGTVDAAVCCCDGLNYILEPHELKEVFRRVRLFLNPGGIFIFDMNTEYKFKEVLANGTFGDMAEDAEYQWDNQYNAGTKINEYHLRVRIGDKDPMVFYERHRQRAYGMGEVSNWLLETGFGSVQLRDCYSDEPPKANTTRVTFIAG
jgi:SAM-dependent methyltransferase